MDDEKKIDALDDEGTEIIDRCVACGIEIHENEGGCPYCGNVRCSQCDEELEEGEHEICDLCQIDRIKGLYVLDDEED